MKSLRDVPSPRPESYDRARTALHSAMAEPVNVAARPKRWFSWPKLSITAVGAAALAAVVVMGPAGTTNTPVEAPQGESPLVRLASEVKAGQLSGDASLVIRTTTAPDNLPYVVYSLYTDKGQKFFGESPQDLTTAATRGDDLAQPYDAELAAAARLAANGDVDKAKVAMVNASRNGWALGLSAAEAEKVWAESQAAADEILRQKGQPVPPAKPRPTGKELENGINSTLWGNALQALYTGGANTEIRAGVLKLLSTIQDVSIGKADVDGQAALTLTAGPALQGGRGTFVLSIDAGNGLPIRGEYTPAKDEDAKTSVATYKSSRVNLADVKAGKI